MILKRYCVTVLDNWTPMGTFWTLEAAKRFYLRNRDCANVFKWRDGEWEWMCGAHDQGLPPTRGKREAMVEPNAQTRKLLPCPFCGGKAHDVGPYSEGLFAVRCDQCGGEVSGFDQCRQDAIDAWNTRADLSHNGNKGGNVMSKFTPANCPQPPW